MRKQIISFVLITALACALSGCITNPSTYIDPMIQSQAPQMIIASKPVGTGFYVLLEKKNQHWKVISIKDTRFFSRDNDEQEILFVNRGLRSIAPSFDPRIESGENADCTPMAQLRERNLYGLCKSYFSSIRIGMTVGGNIVSCAVSLCLAAGLKMELNRNKIQEVVIDADLINLVKNHIAEIEFSNYTSAFLRIMASNDVEEVEAFIMRYSKNDPKNFVTLARDWVEYLKRQSLWGGK